MIAVDDVMCYSGSKKQLSVMRTTTWTDGYKIAKILQLPIDVIGNTTNLDGIHAINSSLKLLNFCPVVMAAFANEPSVMLHLAVDLPRCYRLVLCDMGMPNESGTLYEVVSNYCGDYIYEYDDSRSYVVLPDSLNTDELRLKISLHKLAETRIWCASNPKEVVESYVGSPIASICYGNNSPFYVFSYEENEFVKVVD